MTAAPTVNSAYPAPIEDLLPRARALADALGEIPSRNRLKKELRVGSPKANALRDALAELLTPPAPAAAPEPTEPTPDLIGTPPATPELAPAEQTPPLPASPLEGSDADPGTNITAEVTATARRRPVVWPVLLLAAPAFVAIWAGWVELGKLTGFGKVNLLPGIADGVMLDTAITLPIGMETYAAYALWVWLSGRAPHAARRFAKWSAIASLAIGAAGQVTYHLMAAAGWTSAPWPVTALVACLPVAVLGMGAALAHLMRAEH
ncbi:ABC transporter permease [Phytohabitans houttuyneae]|uniref:ABC transporter permease n=1 Tax=Phytohabitans houttuyneae TaxID=1076126 RepID=A0A6V8KBK3_9ACTN|nr:ABC transporter permease [Phytohabitans houttuyneae]GFJ79801.1 ABC transporter permease [Phytohabitans houttuyneae]